MTDGRSILVTGASGALGRLVVAKLVERGEAVIAGTRDPDALEVSSAPDVDVRHVDFDDPTLAGQFDGVDRLLIISTDQLDVPGRRQRQHKAALDAAKSAGVTFVAYTSMPDPVRSASVPFAIDHEVMEAQLAESGLRYAVLRNSWYQENLLAYLPQIVADGRWYTAAGDGRLPYVARSDAARVAAAVLQSGGEGGVFDVAGPDALTVEDIAAYVRRTLNRPLEVVHVVAARAAVELARQGVATPVIAMIASTEANQAAGRFEVGRGDVQAITGEPPLPLDVFLQSNADVLLSRR